jgi:ankyrin repeat protein
MNKAGGTPLHLAAKNSHIAIVEYLVERGADVTIKDDKGMTAVEHSKKPEITQYLKGKTHL